MRSEKTLLLKHDSRWCMRMLAFFTALLIVSLTILPACKVEASTSTVIAPNAIRIGVGPRYSGTFTIELPKSTDSIKNVKTLKGNKKTTSLKWKIDYVYSSSYYNKYTRNFFVYATGTGTYTLKFDVYRGKSKLTSRSVRIYATKSRDNAIANVTIDGKSVIDSRDPSCTYTTKSSGKVKFIMAKGIKLVNIDVERRDQNGNYRTVTFARNGGKVTFGNVGYSYYQKDDYGLSRSRGYWSYTEFQVQYMDTYSTDPSAVYTSYFTVYRKATRWP